MDPDFMYHRSLAQFFAELMRSVCDSVVIPFKTSDYATRLKEVFVVLESGVKDQLAARNMDKYLGTSLRFHSWNVLLFLIGFCRVNYTYVF